MSKILAIIAIVISLIGLSFAVSARAQQTECSMSSVWHVLQIDSIIDCLSDKQEELKEDLSLLDINQKVLSNTTGIKLYDSIEEYETNVTKTEKEVLTK